MRIVVAPDKFKGSLSASGVAAALADGLRSVLPTAQIVLLPVADGGDGTVAAAVAAGFTQHQVLVDGPVGDPVSAPFAVNGDRAVVELAAACGLSLLPGGALAPMEASTYGLGQVIDAALATGAREIVVGLGGSASTDGGAGMLAALGAGLLDASGTPIGRGGGALSAIASVSLESVRRRLDGASVVVASDVTNPLLGSDGAAAVFGPQKGASPSQVAALDAALGRWADVLAPVLGADFRDTPGAGAAGGAGFGALAGLSARLEPGIDLILSLLDFDAAVADADLVITGEGSLDEQSLAGKAPVGVSEAAARHGVPVIAVAGRLQLPLSRLGQAGIENAWALSDLEPDVARSIAEADRLLQEVGRRIAAHYA
ncbi:glycerate kinase [Branchiibius cervicis]|uniref:Glycerate kinase n=1 Tax=Branchiibius cervicis TaxID=908252 RepID=A0ABW2AVU3_9MICO